MTIKETPLYGFRYIDNTEPWKNIPAVTQQVAERLEQAMTEAQIPPGNPDINVLVTKINNIIGSSTATSPRMVALDLITTDFPLTDGDDKAVSWNKRSADAELAPEATPTRFYPDRTGWWDFDAIGVFSNPSGTGMRGLWFRINGVTRRRGDSRPPPSASQLAEVSVSRKLFLNVGDYVELMATATAAPGITMKANEGASLTVSWFRP